MIFDSRFLILDWATRVPHTDCLSISRIEMLLPPTSVALRFGPSKIKNPKPKIQ